MDPKKKNSMSSLFHQLSNFIAEDGEKWDSWHINAPLFEEFMILGPKDFAEDVKPTILYHYPEDTPTEYGSISRFIFVDGQHFRNIRIASDHEADINLSYDYPEREQVVITKGEAGRTTYIYCLRFRGSALSRPAIDDQNLVADAHYYRSINLMPSCMFAFCFISFHPFHSLLFPILNFLLDTETKYRISSYNLMTAAHLSHYTKSGKGADIVFWPESLIDFRKECLHTFYQTSLPMYGENLCFCMGGTRPLFWKMPKCEDIDSQFAYWGITALLDWINIDDFITLIAYLMAESYVTVVGSNIESLSKVATVIPQLIRPFFWTSPVIPILPYDLLDLLDSPVPTIIGLHNRFVSHVPKYSVVVDIDSKTVKYPEGPKLKMPKDDILKAMLVPLFKAGFGQMNIGIAQNILRICSEFILDTIVKQVITSLITKVNEKNTEGTMFIPEIFYACFQPSDKQFLQMMNDAQYFVAAREQLCRIKTKTSTLGQPLAPLPMMMQPKEGPISGFRL